MVVPGDGCPRGWLSQGVVVPGGLSQGVVVPGGGCPRGWLSQGGVVLFQLHNLSLLGVVVNV